MKTKPAIAALVLLLTIPTFALAHPGINFQFATYSVPEDAGGALIGIVRGDDGPLPITVEVATSDLTAISGVDYAGVTNTVTINPAGRFTEFSVPILNNTLKQPSRSFRITLRAPVNGTLGVTKTTTVTILDQEPGFQFESASYTVAGDDSSLPIKVLRGGNQDTAATIEYATADVTAMNRVDYTETHGTLAFEPGQREKLIVVPILNDAARDSAKEFQAVLHNPTGRTGLGPQTTTTVTILAGAPGPGFELSVYSACKRAKSGEVALTVLRGNARGLGRFSVDYATADGSATSGTDYLAVSGTLEFQAHESMKSLTVPILRTAPTGSARNFRVTLGNPTSPISLGTATATVNILENYPTITPPLKSTLAPRREQGFNVLAWAGGGVLQKADQVAGPWQRLYGRRSPCTVESSNPATFYRVGGTRQASLYIPSSYDGVEPRPLVILLHALTADGVQAEDYLRLRPQAAGKNFLLCYPNGTIGKLGKRFWNATDACCDFWDSGVDDASYLRELIGDISRQFAVDQKRIYLIGYSNGGFMAYRMACQAADLIAGIAVLAGSTFLEPSHCQPSEPVNILHIHGTSDETIPYGGGALVIDQPTFPANMPPFPGAVRAIQIWAGYNGAGDPTKKTTPALSPEAPNTVVTRYTTYPAGGAVELWTMNGASHYPTLSADFSTRVIDWLLAHPKK